MADRGLADSGAGNGYDRASRLVSVREISERYPIPRRLLAEVLKDLTRAGLVESQRGATGGYALARSPDELTLAQIVGALEGSPALTSCEGHGAGHDTCEVVPVCPIRSPLSRIRAGIWNLMERTTLRSLLHSDIPLPLEGMRSSGEHAQPSLAGPH
jgi:Rrf2 family protein